MRPSGPPPPRWTWWALALGLGLALAAPAAGQGAPGDEARFEVAFRNVPLRDALAETARLTGIALAYPADLADGRRATCVRRNASPEALLRCVLDGTGLDFVRASSGTYVLVAALRAEPVYGSLGGRVVDAATGAPLPFAHVLFAEARRATAAGPDGLFTVAGLLPGTHRVVVTHVGYEPAEREVVVAPGRPARVDVPLRGRALAVAPVVVDGLTERVPSDGLGRGERGGTAAGGVASAGAAGAPDVTRGAALVPGVSAALPLADLHVQGGGGAEHVTRLDGVPVRDPVALGRHLGAFSPLALARVTVRKAGFEAAHGSALAGTIDLDTDAGVGRLGGTAQADPAALNLRLDAPLPARGSASVALRHSAWGLYPSPALGGLLRAWTRVDPVFAAEWLREPVPAASLAPLSYAPDVAFSDLHGALRLRPDAASSVSASAYRARNHVGVELAEAQPLAGRVLAFRDVYDWTNEAAQARYARLVGARALVSGRLRAGLHRSAYGYRYGMARTGGDAAEAARALLADLDGRRGSDATHVLGEAAAEADVAYSLGARAELGAGLSAERVRARFEGGNEAVAPFATRADAWLWSGHGHVRAALGLRAQAEAGTRLTWVPARQTLYAEPRLALRYDGGGPLPHALRLAGGLYRQFVNGVGLESTGPAAVVPELRFWLPPTADVAPPRALHLAAEALVRPAPAWTLRAEAFGRWEGRLLALDVPALMAAPRVGGAPPRALAPADVLAPARGRTLGAAVHLARDGPRLRTAAALSAEHAERTVPGRFGSRPVPAPWAEPLRATAEADLALGRGLRALATGRGVWGRAWGYRHAYYAYQPAAAAGLDLGAPGAHRLPPLLTLDLGAAQTWAAGPARVRLELGVANVLGRANVYDQSLGAPADPSAARGLPGRRAYFVLRLER